MGFLSARDEQTVVKEFERLAGPVRLTVFASGLGPETNAQAVALIKEVAAPHERISVGVLTPHLEREGAPAYGIDVTPPVGVEGARDYGIRFLGVPAGYEFSNLIDSIVAASSGESGLSEDTTAALGGLTEDVVIKVL